MAAVALAAKAVFTYVASASAAVAAGTASIAQIATVIGVNVGLGALSKALSPKPKTGAAAGASNDWRADPNAPVPIIYGRYTTGGYIVFQKPHGSGDKYLTTVSVFSIGPVAGIDKQWFGDNVLTTTNPSTSGVVSGTYGGAIWTRWQLGARPEANALPVIPSSASVPEWTSAHKLSGLAACISTFDTSNRTKLPKGIEKAAWDVRGQLCYDPRLDSTYPGGSGTHRISDRSTWTFSENPALCALNWCLINEGVNALSTAIRLSNFVAGANIADANGWTIGGMVTTADNKWGALTAILEAGAGMPVNEFGQVGAVFQAPGVSVGTLTREDIVGPCRIVRGGGSVDQFFNTAIPFFNSQAHKSQSVAGSSVSVSSFVTEDGAPITQEARYTMVYDPDQAAQLSRYKIWESRNGLQITAECKMHMMRFRVGECLTVSIAGSAIVSRKMKIFKVTPNLQNMTCTLALREELDAKHTNALAGTSTAPPVISFDITGEVQDPIPSEWALIPDNEGSDFYISVEGAPTNISGLTAISIYYKRTVDPDWISFASLPPSGSVLARVNELVNGTSYDIGVRYVDETLTSDLINVGSATP